MSQWDEVKFRIDQVLAVKGMRDFRVTGFDLAPKHLISHESFIQNADSSEITRMLDDQVQSTLQSIGMHHLRMSNLNLALVVGSECRPGEEEYVDCKLMPDGSTRCTIKCRKAIV